MRYPPLRATSFLSSLCQPRVVLLVFHSLHPQPRPSVAHLSRLVHPVPFPASCLVARRSVFSHLALRRLIPLDRPSLPFFRLQLDRCNEAQLSNNTSFSDFLPRNSSTPMRSRLRGATTRVANCAGTFRLVHIRSSHLLSFSRRLNFSPFLCPFFFSFSFFVRSTRWFLTRITNETATAYKRFRLTVGLERERGAKKWEIGYSRWKWCVLFARPCTFHRWRWTAHFVSLHPD